MRGVISYLLERFQPAAVITLSTATAALLVGSSTSGHALEPLLKIRLTGLVTLVFLAFLLRTRVTDEFKDRDHDDVNYPNRPVQRGLISTAQLKRMRAWTFLVELVAVALVSQVSTNASSALWYLPVLAFSYLTSKEFFASKYFEKHFTQYFVAHQLIFVWFMLWIYKTVSMNISLETFLAFLLAFVFLMATVEIVRKFEIRTNPAGQEVKDTYVAVWGLTGAISALTALIVLCGLLYCATLNSLVPLITALPVAACIVFFRKKFKVVQVAAFTNFLAISAIVYLQ